MCLPCLQSVLSKPGAICSFTPQGQTSEPAFQPVLAALSWNTTCGTKYPRALRAKWVAFAETWRSPLFVEISASIRNYEGDFRGRWKLGATATEVSASGWPLIDALASGVTPTSSAASVSAAASSEKPGGWKKQRSQLNPALGMEC